MTNQNTSLQALSHRRQAATLLITKPDGAPLQNQEITITQTRHEFLFGCNGFEFLARVEPGSEEAEKGATVAKVTPGYHEKFLQLFNFTTLPFYWSEYEPEQGKTIKDRIMQAAQWCEANHLLLKGHPLCWFALCPEWLNKLPGEEALAVQLHRVRREVADFAGHIDIWDVVNEAVLIPLLNKIDNAVIRMCQRLGRVELIARMFEMARATNPGAFLILNDFDTTVAFDVLVESCLKKGVKIDALGMQSHMHTGIWGEEKLLEVISRLSRFNLPIHFTEMSILSSHLVQEQKRLHGQDQNDPWGPQPHEWPSTPKGEEQQAEEAIRHYKALFANPAIKAITWWDFADGKWLNAPSGLLRRDGTPKPAYEELRKLIKGEWWMSPTTFRTDEEGRIELEGFLGDYELTHQGRKLSFSLKMGEAKRSLKLEV